MRRGGAEAGHDAARRLMNLTSPVSPRRQALEHIEGIGLKEDVETVSAFFQNLRWARLCLAVSCNRPSSALPHLREAGAPGTDYRSFRLPGIWRGRSIRAPRSRKSGIRFPGPRSEE